MIDNTTSIFNVCASHNVGSSNMDQMIPKAGRVSMFPPEVDLSVCWMDFYCFFFSALILFPVLKEQQMFV